MTTMHRLTASKFKDVKQTFLLPFVNGFLIDAGKQSRVGVVLYADEPRYVAPLAAFTDKSDLQWRINELEYVFVNFMNSVVRGLIKVNFL